MNHTLLRTATGLTALAAGLLIGAGAASATPAAAPLAAPSTVDVTAAHAAATTPETTAKLGRFLAGTGTPGVAANASVPVATGATVAVYYLNPAFVAAGTQSVPVARQAFLATEATGPDGRRAAVWTARVGGRWVEVNIASGGDEIDYTRQAASTAPGAQAFYEPQLHAWYALSGDRVRALNADAQRAIGTAPVSLATYRQAVRTRYADKLPGSPYDRAGMLGGIDPGNHPVAAPAPAPASAGSGAGTGPVLVLGAVGVAGALAAAFAVRRARSHTAG